MACHIPDTRIDSREVYPDDTFTVACDCNADKACVECVDDDIYAGEADQYNGGYIDAEQEAYYNGNP